MRKRFVAIVLLLTTAAAHADAMLAGVGTRTCAQFASDYRKDPERIEAVYNNWALGFMAE
jgi:hypothetical protein